VILAISVQPAAKRSGIEGIDVWRGRLQVAVKSVPLKGAANEEVCELISELFGIPRALIEIIAGHRSRQKSVKLSNINLSDIESYLEVFCAE